MGLDEILQRYVLPQEHERVLEEAHDGIVGVHYGGEETTRNILRAGLCWPIVHGDTTDYARSWNEC